MLGAILRTYRESYEKLSASLVEINGDTFSPLDIMTLWRAKNVSYTLIGLVYINTRLSYRL